MRKRGKKHTRRSDEAVLVVPVVGIVARRLDDRLLREAGQLRVALLQLDVVLEAAVRLVALDLVGARGNLGVGHIQHNL